MSVIERLVEKMNPIMMLMQMVRGGKNPQSMIMNMLQNQMPNNPMANNFMDMLKSNDRQGIEQLGRNIMKERGLDFDTEFNSFKKNLGL